MSLSRSPELWYVTSFGEGFGSDPVSAVVLVVLEGQTAPAAAVSHQSFHLVGGSVRDKDW